MIVEYSRALAMLGAAPGHDHGRRDLANAEGAGADLDAFAAAVPAPGTEVEVPFELVARPSASKSSSLSAKVQDARRAIRTEVGVMEKCGIGFAWSRIPDAKIMKGAGLDASFTILWAMAALDFDLPEQAALDE
ncbi:hypothetical protein AK812_SmicGene35476 [Symbiodinium microadriaticum]|uniref:Uncharacterized protein n=1 Tax=Symbiodinium microadriaticum TaxID=2951 RepID=A0A1Q9CLD7_SYMMI|nr:hypothetical protein AK812_SmicGene35476 [Symbiodinium microadriaticum]